MPPRQPNEPENGMNVALRAYLVEGEPFDPSTFKELASNPDGLAHQMHFVYEEIDAATLLDPAVQERVDKMSKLALEATRLGYADTSKSREPEDFSPHKKHTTNIASTLTEPGGRK